MKTKKKPAGAGTIGAAVLGLGIGLAAGLALTPLAFQAALASSGMAAAQRAIIGTTRANTTAALAPKPGDTLLLRRRSDYESEAAMIAGEIAIIKKESAALMRLNMATQAALEDSQLAATRLLEKTLSDRRSEVAAFRRDLRLRRETLEAQIESTEREVATTRALREGASDVGDLEAWRREERRLVEERNRLRALLDRISLLETTFG